MVADKNSLCTGRRGWAGMGSNPGVAFCFLHLEFAEFFFLHLQSAEFFFASAVRRCGLSTADWVVVIVKGPLSGSDGG